MKYNLDQNSLFGSMTALQVLGTYYVHTMDESEVRFTRPQTSQFIAYLLFLFNT